MKGADVLKEGICLENNLKKIPGATFWNFMVAFQIENSNLFTIY